MLSFVSRSAYLPLWFCSVSGEKLQSCPVLKWFKYSIIATGHVKLFEVNLFTVFVLHGMESGLQNDQSLRLKLS